MSVSQLGRRGVAIAAALIGGAVTAHAQQGAQLLYEWQGRVDHEVQIFPGRGGYSVQGIGGQENPGRFRNSGGVPRGQGQLTVQRLSGRGPVDVIGGNVVRIRDPQGGTDFYRVRVYWQPTGGSTGRDDRRQSDDRRNQDDRRSRDDRRPYPY